MTAPHRHSQHVTTPALRDLHRGTSPRLPRRALVVSLIGMLAAVIPILHP